MKVEGEPSLPLASHFDASLLVRSLRNNRLWRWISESQNLEVDQVISEAIHQPR